MWISVTKTMSRISHRKLFPSDLGQIVTWFLVLTSLNLSIYEFSKTIGGLDLMARNKDDLVYPRLKCIGLIFPTSQLLQISRLNRFASYD